MTQENNRAALTAAPWIEKIEVREVRCLPMALRLSVL
jgi:hypothetical protein